MVLKQLSQYIFILCSYLYFANGHNGHHSLPTTPEIIRSNNFSVESHKITTDDGYILEIFRILPKDQEPQPGVYLLMHDIMGCSDDFVVGDIDSSFAYYYPLLGYELWLGNARGSRYSMEHITLSPNDREFWNFSMHEIGYYDVPKIVDHIISTTGTDDLSYYGFGQGGTVGLITITTRPEYNYIIDNMQTFGSLLFVGNVTSPYINKMAYEILQNETYVNGYKSRKFIPDQYMFDNFGQPECNVTTSNSSICDNFYFLSTSYYSTYDYTASDESNILLHRTTTCSTNQLFQLAQNLVTGRFAEFDYNFGTGSSVPPAYNLSNIILKYVVFASSNDISTSPLAGQLLQNYNVYYFANNICPLEHIDFYNITKFFDCYI